MRVPRLRLAALALVSGVALSGCAYGLNDPYGYGGIGVGYGNTGYGYSPYGYGGYGRYGGYGGYGAYGGYGSPYGYGGYGSPYGYGGYGSPYGYGYDPFGWYGGYYYPGSGNYVYDRDRHRRVMTDEQRQHWRALFSRLSNPTAGTTATATTRAAPRENWTGFNRRDRTSTSTTTTNSDRGFWRGRAATSSSTDSTTTTVRTRSDDGGHRGRDRSDRE